MSRQPKITRHSGRASKNKRDQKRKKKTPKRNLEELANVGKKRKIKIEIGNNRTLLEMTP